MRDNIFTSDLRVSVGTTVKFNGRNYTLWSQVFVLSWVHKVVTIILADKMLDPKDSEYAAWCQYDGLVKTWMLNSLEPEIAASVGLTSTAKEMWDDIKEMFSNDGNNSRISSLFQQLVDNKEGERSLPEFFAAYRGIINELRELLPLSTDLDSEVSRGKPICMWFFNESK